MPRLNKPCLTCGTLTRNPTRCDPCHRAARSHYKGNYSKQSKQVRENAHTCWICGKGTNPNDPWTADHYHPGDPNSPLLPAHRSCNSARGNTPPPL